MNTESNWQSQKVIYTVLAGDYFVLDYDILWKHYFKTSSIVTVIKLMGSTNISTNFSEYCKKVDEFEELSQYLILDFNRVDYIDFAVSEKIFCIHDKFKQKKGNLFISGVSDQLLNILEMYGILEQVKIFEYYEDAFRRIEFSQNYVL